ncbi:ketose-bisphosphate aldolase [Petroclostridium sp. X23]|uniref:class II fructose-bisphosphate aldolase n=1 Tax=Petroclostridium sp. X23 TaxID=3045146 RepID=UPI0024AE32C8|nr:ketose-bisphosphate aldolase [Petroclostridium sp. X23]WHH60892.1 ketose-bisphosphate aldolase [Petroclostridium sp. X23]
MPIVPLSLLMEDADRRSYAVPAFNIDNLEMAKAIFLAAEEEKAPFIVAVGQGAIAESGIDVLAGIVHTLAEKTSIPVALHLDHSRSFPQIVQCLKAGFSSVMFDGSHFELVQNIAITKNVVEAAYAVGASVEAELGKISGTEDDLTVEEASSNLVDSNDVISLTSAVKFDALAVAIGNAHGMYKGEPKLDFELLKKVNEITGIPLVLHGGSGIPDEMIRKAISLGICKINVATELRISFIQGISEKCEEGCMDIYKVLNYGIDKVKQTAKEKIRLFGTSGKAR